MCLYWSNWYYIKYTVCDYDKRFETLIWNKVTLMFLPHIHSKSFRNRCIYVIHENKSNIVCVIRFTHACFNVISVKNIWLNYFYNFIWNKSLLCMCGNAHCNNTKGLVSCKPSKMSFSVHPCWPPSCLADDKTLSETIGNISEGMLGLCWVVAQSESLLCLESVSYLAALHGD